MPLFRASSGLSANLGWAQPTQYHVRLLQVVPPKLAIKATFQIEGRALEMDITRPGDIPEINAQGTERTSAS